MKQKQNTEESALKRIDELENGKFMNSSYADARRMWQNSFTISSKMSKKEVMRAILMKFIGRENTDDFFNENTMMKNTWINIQSETTNKGQNYYVFDATEKKLEIKCLVKDMIHMFRFEMARPSLFQNPLYPNNVKVTLILIKDYPFDNRKDFKFLEPIKKIQKQRKSSLVELVRKLESDKANVK